MRLAPYSRFYLGIFIALLCWGCLYSARSICFRNTGNDVVASEDTCLDEVILNSTNTPVSENLGPLHCICIGAALLLLQLLYTPQSAPPVRVMVRLWSIADLYSRGPPAYPLPY